MNEQTPASAPRAWRRHDLGVATLLASIVVGLVACSNSDAPASRSSADGGDRGDTANGCACNVTDNGVSQSIACGTSACVNGTTYTCDDNAGSTSGGSCSTATGHPESTADAGSPVTAPTCVAVRGDCSATTSCCAGATCSQATGLCCLGTGATPSNLNECCRSGTRQGNGFVCN